MFEIEGRLFAGRPARTLQTEARHLLAIEQRGEDVEALYVAMARVLLLVLPLVGLLIGISLMAASAAA